MSCSIVEQASGMTFVTRRNNSLPAGGRRLVLGSLAALIFAISLGFALSGAWMVLPFAGLEVLVVCLAFRYMERQAADFEQLSLDGERIVVERGRRGRTRRVELNRHWARVDYQAPGGSQAGRLVLRAHGSDVEFGTYLTDAQKADVARRLKEHLEIR
ncbi:MAG TPA: DUF2244 domain-containing protein [Burkholderiales bacterium]|jgi:uncharacterized membrane protein|nr:DUF2244 domain-containing protein [Burkholderiales bacterium]